MEIFIKATKLLLLLIGGSHICQKMTIIISFSEILVGNVLLSALPILVGGLFFVVFLIRLLLLCFSFLEITYFAIFDYFVMIHANWHFLVGLSLTFLRLEGVKVLYNCLFVAQVLIQGGFEYFNCW